jgi:CheY-like chemotaxis protein
MKVLLVEDEEIIAHVHQIFVERCGAEIIGVATDSESAFRQAVMNRPDIILMDIRLDGDADGIETAQAIQNVYPIPVIYVSGNSDDRTLERAALTNMLAFLVKPITPDELQKVFAEFNKNFAA